MKDAIYALRQLIRRPGHTFAVVICLAAGLVVSIGSFSMMLSVLYGNKPGITDRKNLVRAFIGYETSAGERVDYDDLSMSDSASAVPQA